ncbi:MAG: 6-bladed beta-propeller [Nitrosotalea sp.]
MKFLFLAIFSIIFILGTMSLANAQADNFSVNFISTFGSRGANAGYFHNPQGIALDNSGNVYVVDQVNNRVEKFDSKGNFTSVIGYASAIGYGGSEDGQLSVPTSVALDKSGNIYVTDINNYRVEKFDPSGNFVLKFGTKGNSDGQFSSLQGIAVDDSGNIYVTDLLHPIQKFDSAGNFVSDIGSDQIVGAQGIALDKSGNVYALDADGTQVIEFSSDGSFMKRWGSFCNIFTGKDCIDPDGSGPFALGDGQFKDPNGIAIDNSGNVYVTDTGNNRVEIFDSSGHFFYKFGTNGNGDGQFSDAIGIAVGNDGSLYVVDQNNDRVEIFNITYGNATSAPNNVLTTPPTAPVPIIETQPPVPAWFVSSFGSPGSKTGQFSFPQGIALDGSGNVYVVENANNRVEKFDSKGNYISTIGSSGSGNGQFSSPTGIAVDKSGNIYVSDIGNYRIEKFDPAGNFVLKFGTAGKGNGQFFSLQGIAVDDSGNIYVSDLTNFIQKFDSSGNFIKKIGGDGILNGANAVAVDKSGDMYVVADAQIVEFSANGTVITKWGSYCEISTPRGCVDPDGSGPLAIGDGQFNDPNGIAVDISGNVYVTDTGNNRVQIFDPSGHFIYKFGSDGSYSGQFSQPNGITINKSGNIYVVDQGNARVQIFNINNMPAVFPNNTVTSSSTTPSTTRSSTPVNPAIPLSMNQTTAMASTHPTIDQPQSTSVPILSKIQKIPSWAKNIFSYYEQGQISEDELIGAINFLVQQNIVQLK